MIRLGNTWVNPNKVSSIRVPNMLNEEAPHRIELYVEGVEHPIVVKNDLLKADAEELCAAFAAALDNATQSFGAPDDNAANPQES